MAHIKRLVIHGFKSFAKKTEIPFDPGINTIIGPNGAGKCLTGESLVQLADGSLERIDELVNSKLDKATKTEDGYIIMGDGTKVKCLDMTTLKTVDNSIRAFIKRTSPKKLLKIKTRSGREIKSTKYHPFFILGDGKVRAAKAEELKKGVRIAVPRKFDFKLTHNYFVELLDLISIEENIYVPYREEFVFILKSMKGELTWKELAGKIGVSYYVIKGVLDKQAVHFCNIVKILRKAGLSDLEVIELVQEIRANGKNTKFSFRNSPEFSRFFGYLLAEGRLAQSSQIWFTNGDKEIVEDYVNLVKKLFNKNPLIGEYKPNCWDVIIFSEPLKKILGKLGMASKTENKTISNILLKHSSNEEISNMLNGLYSGDGYVSKKSVTVEITTKSKKLAKSIENCLLRLGILSVEKDVVKGYKDFFGKYKTISVYGVNNLSLFHDNISLVHKMKTDRIKSHLHKKCNPNLDLIEVNALVKNTARELGINIKNTRKNYPVLDAYCYNQCTPSRSGLLLLTKEVFTGNSQSLEQLKKIVESDIYWDELVEVEEIEGEEWVYDLAIEDNHNFIANNIFAHNSNVSDAICFVLGRLSAKSIRAEKAKNLIFMGSKFAKPAKEGYVEIVFDNSDGAFAINTNEVSLKRIVKLRSASVYKINGETKTRAEVIETLAQAGIDPYGFNLILQGQIQSIVKIHSEERRKIIEEVAGISIYESRKEKSLKELEKTDSRLKEISTILRERTAYLNNLEKERAQAKRYQELKQVVQRSKASIINRKLSEKQKEIDSIVRAIEKDLVQRDKREEDVKKVQERIESMSESINKINKHIQEATGLEQGRLRDEITNLRAELEGLRVRKEGFENRSEEFEHRIEEMKKSIPSMEGEIEELRRESPLVAKKSEELKKKKVEIAELEKERKRALTLKSELQSLRERIYDKQRQIDRVNTSSELLVRRIEELEKEIVYGNMEDCSKALIDFKKNLENKNKELNEIREKEIENEKIVSISESEIKRNGEIKNKIEKIDTCPMCQSRMTESHKEHVFADCERNINYAKDKIGKASEEFSGLKKKSNAVKELIDKLRRGVESCEREVVMQRDITEKKDSLKKDVAYEKVLRSEVKELESKRAGLESKSGELSKIEESYQRKMLDIEEISSRTLEDVDNSLMYKQRELEQTKNIISQSSEDLKDLEENVDNITMNIERAQEKLNEKEKKENELKERFKKMYAERDELQRKIQETSLKLYNEQNEVRQIEEQINYLKVGRAKVDGEKQVLEMDMSEYVGVELLQGTIEKLDEKLKKAQSDLENIGSINMRALEVYEQVKKEYDIVREKAEILEKETNQILSIIEEIDKKKKKAFMKTFNAINEVFSRNFSRLSAKGQAYLEIENKEDIFEGGVEIVVRLAKGKYFDVSSLSGGEQTMVALSLLFAIQEYKPYQFYILDEIDAALDKRNSERLAALLNKYMKAGQYIIITHNDAIILNSQVLYGVSMHEGVSKILSLDLGENKDENKS